MAVFKSGGKWYGRVISGGVTHNLPKSYTNKKDALNAVQKLKESLKTRKTIDRIAKLEMMVQDEVEAQATNDIYANLLIPNVWEVYEKLGHNQLETKAESTRNLYKVYLKKVDDYCIASNRPGFKLSDIDAKFVSDFVAWMKPTCSHSRLSNIMFSLKKVWRDFGVVSTHRCFKSNPFDIYKQTKVRTEYRQEYNEEHVKKIYDLLEHPRTKTDRQNFPQLKLFVTIARRTGLRKVDICQLRWGQVILDDDINKRNIILNPQKTKDKEVVIPITDDLYELLKEQYKVSGDGYFVSPFLKSAYESKNIDKLHQKVLKRCGIETEKEIDGRKHTTLCIHSWRHYYISSLAQRGVGEQVIRSLVAHSSIDIHRHYTHINTKTKVDAVKKLTIETGLEETITITKKEYDRLLALEIAYNELVANGAKPTVQLREWA